MESKLQIISGKHKGRKLFLPVSARPTQNRSRIALFNMIDANSWLQNESPVRVWDAFAGSGAFGIEIISRYSKAEVLFTDFSAASIDTINKNLNVVSEKAVVKKTDALTIAAETSADMDLVFVDAPYEDYKVAINFVSKLGKAMKPGSIVIWESDKSLEMKFSVEDFEVVKDKSYGRARFLVLEKKSPESK